MPLLIVTLVEGREEEVIRDLIARLTDQVVETLAVDRERVRIVVNEVPANRWAVGGVTKEELP